MLRIATTTAAACLALGGAACSGSASGDAGHGGHLGAHVPDGGSGGATGGAGGDAGASAVPAFGDPATLSDESIHAFVPAVAAHDGRALVIWHEFPLNQGARIAFSVVTGGVAGPAQVLPESYPGAKQPTVAATTNGYTIAYTASDGAVDVVRAARLDLDGQLVDGPVTLSPSVAAMARVAAAGDDELFAWTDGTTHFFARRGAGETVDATAVGTTLASQGILNFPRVALGADGTSFVAYRDGGVDGIDWDVLLVTRPPGGSFDAPVNVSQSPGLLSDDISLALELDGTLDLAWVDQDGANVDAFEVEHAARAPDGTLDDPARYGDQGLWTWKPSVVRGRGAVWYTGFTSGPMFFGTPDIAPTPILVGEVASHVALALGPDGAHHLAYATKPADKTLIRYAYAP